MSIPPRRGSRATRMVVRGSVRVPGDKSISHRALILAALSSGTTRVRNILESADVHSTAGVLRALGVHVPVLSPDLSVTGVPYGKFVSPSEVLDCGNSGTTTRLMCGVVAALDGRSATFDGDASLRRRPMRRVATPLRAMGGDIRFDDDATALLPMHVTGRVLRDIEFASEHASAQVKGAVLLAALVSGVSATVREPAPSRDHSERMLAARGARLEVLSNGVRLHGGNTLTALDVDVPADPSSAAFIAALAALSDDGEVALDDVCLNPTRIAFFEVLQRMGVHCEVTNERLSGGEKLGTIIVRPASLSCTSVRGDEIPRCIDELPLIACLAARATGETRIADAAELRVKESDRIAAVVENLRAIGVDADELPDGMIIRGTDAPLRGRVVTHGDHRLAMAFGVLAACPENAIHIDDPACVSVSYPQFWSDIARIVTTDVASARAGSGAQHLARSESNAESSKSSSENHPLLVIAIDGPAASGKSSTAQWVAEKLGVRHVDSGAFYRALTALAIESRLPASEWTSESVLANADRITLHLKDRSVGPLIDGNAVDDALRSADVTRHVSQVAQMPAVRDWVNERVREAGRTTDVVVDGRDIGTAVFPEASLKVFLIADPWERARRRLLQRLGRLPVESEVADETERLVARDALDATQSAPARDAITIDTTRLTQAEQVDRIVALARATRERLGR